MAAPTLQAQGSIASVTTGNLAITLPTYAANDIVVITTVGWVPNTTTGTNTQSLASPWTKYSPDITTITASIIDAEYAFWWARATSASSLGTTVTITRPTSWDTGTDTCWAGRAYVISGCETTGNPYDQLTATAISTAANPAFPAVTVNAGERNVIVFMAKADNTATPTAATGYTVGTEVTTTTGTDAAFQSYSDVTNTSLSAVTPTGGTAPAQGGSVYWGVSFRKPLVTVTRTGSDTGTGTESASRVLKALRTASDTGTGTESATGRKVVVFQRTASDTGTGTESASRVIGRLRTASDTGTGSESASRVVARVRTASDTGVGSESAVGNIVPGTPAHQRTASDTGVGSESAVGVFWSILARTGSDAGSGSESASRVLVKVRTASDTGSGSETASRVVVKTRSATASGTGTESASFAFVGARTGSATGVGSETASRVLVALRTASSTGSGASSVVSAKALFRTGLDTGVGTETAVGCKLFTATATATGAGTETPANWSKSLIFRPPSDDQFAWAEYSDPSADAWFLSKLQRGSRARNIYKLTSGTYTNTDPLDPTLVDKVYYGGHQHFVTEQEKADLIAAGYTVT